MDAWLERAVQRRVSRPCTSLFERDDLGVWASRVFVTAVADNDAVTCHDARADSRIRRRAAKSSTRVLKSPPHPSGVVHHSC